MEVRDLAYTGKRKLAALGVAEPDRDGKIQPAGEIDGLDLPEHCEVVIPPAVCRGVGADGLAMILQSGLLKEEVPALITDYGTNAEMALYHEGRIITGSAAAGPALEGQQISCGMVAAPGVVADLLPLAGSCHRLVVLDEEMLPKAGQVIALEQGQNGNGPVPMIRGITGTGVVAVIHAGLEDGHIRLPLIHTPDGQLHLTPEVFFTERDLQEAGKAIGAIRAGHLTLCHEAGISYGDVQSVYMAGAAGTYVDPEKAQSLGLLPPMATTISQLGNTSLQMARDLVVNTVLLQEMQELAERLRADYCMFAASQTFKKIYMLELSYWMEGMPMYSYRDLLARYGFGDLPVGFSTPKLQRKALRDIAEIGRMGLRVVEDIGQMVCRPVTDCTACGCCVSACPQVALSVRILGELLLVQLDQSRCAGVSCKRCEQVCPEKVLEFGEFFTEQSCC
jgi:methylamine methyltransferase corrinoid protein reductive activase